MAGGVQAEMAIALTFLLLPGRESFLFICFYSWEIIVKCHKIYGSSPLPSSILQKCFPVRRVLAEPWGPWEMTSLCHRSSVGSREPDTKPVICAVGRPSERRSSFSLKYEQLY